MGFVCGDGSLRLFTSFLLLQGSAFFPSFQGRAKSVVGTTEYRGGEVLQHAPIFTALGNHDVMGRTNITNTSLDVCCAHQ